VQALLFFFSFHPFDFEVVFVFSQNYMEKQNWLLQISPITSKKTTLTTEIKLQAVLSIGDNAY